MHSLISSARSRFVALAGFALIGGLVATHSFAKDDEKGPESLQGQVAPDFSLPSLADGKHVKLSAMKGKVVVLDYWATWCPPCRKSLPHLNEMSQDKDLAGKGVVFYAIDSGEGKDKVAPFIAKNKYTFNVLLDEQSDFGKKYLVSGIPTTVVVGKDGKVAKAFVGFDENESPKDLKAAIEEAAK